MQHLARTFLVLAIIALVLDSASARAADTYAVTNEAELRAAIDNAVGGDTILLQANITLTGDLPAITSSITFDGGGHTLSGADSYRGLVIVQTSDCSPPIDVAVQNLTIANTVALGGAGGTGAAGGGGGAGLGGALFIGASATVTVSNVNVVSSSAIGGSGGEPTSTQTAGGGGGLGGAGGSGIGTFDGGGGGVGGTATGGTISPGSPGIVTGGLSGGSSQFPGGASGGGGGAGSAAGGGGIGGAPGDIDGGAGGYGGGGGGSARFGGGAGGIGGGGGGGSTVGGNGGYGGGGGGGLETPGLGGAFAGDGGVAGGGGGAGLGGAIFVDDLGRLRIVGTLNINGSAVAAGAGAAGAASGQALGAGIFLGGFGSLRFDVPEGGLATIADAIVDETGAGLVDAGFWWLDKRGAGTLVLGGENRYSGGTFVGAGTLQIGTERNIGSGDVIVNDDATLSITGNGNFTQSLFVGSNSRISIAAGRTATWSGTIFDYDGFIDEPIDEIFLFNAPPLQGTLHVTGGGVLALTNPQNAYATGTIVGGGSTVRVSTDGALGASVGNVTLGDDTGNGTLSITPFSNFVSSRAMFLAAAGGIVEAQAGSSVVLNGVISGAGGLTKTGTGTLVLNGANSYAGATSVEAGLLRAGRAGIFSQSAGMNVAGGATLDLGTFGQSVAALTGNGFVFVEAATLTVGDTGASSLFGGTIAGSGRLVKSGAGILALTGANFYSGGTHVAGGVLLGNTTSLQGDIDNDAMVVFDQGFTGTYAGRMLGAGALVKNGAGALTLSGVNDYKGGTFITAGTLIGSSSSLRGAIFNDATLVFDQTIDGNYLGSITGRGNLLKSGGGTLVLAQGNSYSGGTEVLGGVLQAGASGVFGTGPLAIGGGAGVDLAGFGQSISSLSGDGTLTLGSAMLEVASGNFNGSIVGPGSLLKSGPGSLFLGGANSYSGNTRVVDGALVGSTTSLQGHFINDALVVFDQSFNGTFGGTMVGSGVLQKTGSGTLTLASALEHTGGTLVTGGALAGTASTLRGLIVNNSSVTFGGEVSGVFEGTLAGGGLFTKTGSGSLVILGSHAHTGLLNILEGTLALDGTLASRVSVAPNATLRALGTIFGTTTVAGSLVVPSPVELTSSLALIPASLVPSEGSGQVLGSWGRSTSLGGSGDALTTPPLLTIGGDLIMTPGSRLFLPIGSGPNPTVLVGGNARFDGTTIDVTPIEPMTQRAASFLAVAAQNGLQLTDTIGRSSDPQLIPFLRQDHNLLFVTMLNFRIPLSTSVTDPNASSVGAAIDRMKNTATGDRFAVIGQLTGLGDAELNDALRQVSGEAHATILQFGMRDSEMANDIVRRQMYSRRREGRLGDRLGRSWWGQFGAERGSLRQGNQRVGTMDVANSMGGMDYRPSEKWLFGFGGGFAGGSLSLTDLPSNADVQSPRGFGYAGYRPKGFGIRGGGSFARQKAETDRRMAFQLRLPDEFGGGPLGEGVDRTAEAEDVTLVNDQWSDWDDEHEIKTYTLQYVVGFRRATFTRRGFIETGADSLSLLMPEQTVTLKQSNVLIHLWRRETDFRPFFEFLYRREMTDGKTTTALEFPGEPDSRFFVDGLPAPKHITNARGGATWFSAYGTWTFEYEYRRATGQTTHRADLRFRF